MMSNDYRVLLSASIEQQKTQNDINSQIKKLKTEALKLNIDLDDKSAKQAILNLEKQKDQFDKKNISAMDLEIKKREEQSKIFANQIKSQMQERISAENKVQAELDKTAKKMQAATTLNYDKTQLNNRANSFINNNPRLSDELINRIKVIQSSLKDVDAVGFKNLKKEFGNITSEAQALGKVGDTVFSKLNKNIFQFLSFMGSATIVMGGIRAIQGMILEVKNLDKAIISLKKVTDETDETYKKFINSASSSAKALGSSVSDIVEMTATWAKLGYTIQEASKLAEVSTVYANVGEINNTEKAVGDLVTVMKAYGIESKNAMEITDKFNEIGNKYATDAASLGEGISNAASSLALAGNSLDESLAMLTSMTEITQNASESGNALKILAMRLRGMKGELEELGEESEGIESISKIQTQILNLTKGKVNIFDDLDPTKFKSTYDIMLGISKVYKDMAETDQAELLEIIAGKQRGNSIAALLTSMSQAENVLQTSLESSGSAMREQQEYMKGIEYSADRMKASFQELSSNTINSGWVKTFYDLSNILINVVDKVGLFNVALITTASILNAKKGLVAFGWIDALITKMGVATGAATTLSFAMSAIVPAALIVGGIVLIKKAYDHFNTTTKELIDSHNKSIEKSKELASEYKNLESSLESLESKQNDVSKKLKELYALRENQTITASEISYLEQLEQQNLKLEKQIEYEKVLLDIAGAKAEKEAVNTMSEKTQSSNFTTTSFSGEVKYDLITDSEKIKENTQQINALNREMKNYESVVNGIKLPIQEQERYNNQLKYYRESYERGIIGEETYKENVRITQSLLDGSLTFEDYTKKIESFKQKQEGYIQENDSLIETQQALNDSIVSTSGANYELKVSTQEIIDKAKESAVVYSELENSMQGFNGEVSQLNVVPKLPLDISAYEKEIDKLQESLKSLQTAKEKLNKKELTSSDVLDLLQSFPMLSPYIDLTAEGFGNLAKGLKDVSNVKVDALVSDLGEIRDSLSDADKLALDTLVNIISNMGEEAVSSSDKIKTLSEAIEDLKSSYDVFELAKKDIKEIGEISIDTIGKLNQTYPQLRQLLNSYLVDKGNEKELLLAIQGIYKDNEQVYRETIANQEVMTVNFINELNDKYGVGIQNHATFAKARLDIETELISTLGTMWSNFYDLQTGELIDNEVLDTISKYAPNYYGNLQKMEGQVKAYIEIGNRVKEIADSVSFNPASLSGGKKGGSKDKKEFSQVIDWISIQIEKLKEKSKKAVDDIGKYISYKTKNKKIDIAIQAKIKEQDVLKGLQDEYTKAAENVKLPKKYQDLVDNGGIDIEVLKGESGEKIAKQIDEYIKWKNKADEVKKSIEEINKEVKDLSNQSLDNITEYFNIRRSYLDSRENKRRSVMELRESQGKSARTSDIDFMMSIRTKDFEYAKRELQEYEKVFNAKVSADKNYKYSEDYYNAKIQLNELTIAANNAQIALIELANEKVQIKFDKQDLKIDKISNILSEIDLYSEFAEKDSVEQIVLFQTGYEQAIKKAKELSDAINTLNKDYEKGKVNPTQYKQRMDELTSSLNANAQSMLNYQNDIVSAMKNRYDKQLKLDKEASDNVIKNIEKEKKARIDALNEELDKFKKSIDERKKALKEDQKTDEYNKEVDNANKEILKIEDRIAILKNAELTGDREAAKERRKAEEELTKKKEDLAKKQKDREVDLAVDALDEEGKKYEELKKNQIKDAENMFNSDIEKEKLKFDTKQKNLETLYENEKQLILDANELTKNEATNTFNYIKELMTDTYKISPSYDFGKAMGSNGGTKQPTPPSKKTPSDILGSYSDSNKKQDVSGLSGLNKYVASQGYKTLSTKQMVELAQSLGLMYITDVSQVGTDEVGKINKNLILEELKRKIGKFANTGMVKANRGGLQSIGEDGLVAVRDEEVILSRMDGKTFRDFVPVMKGLMQEFKSPKLNNVTNNSSPIFNFENMIQIQGNADMSTVNKLKYIENDIVKKIVNEIGKR